MQRPARTGGMVRPYPPPCPSSPIDRHGPIRVAFAWALTRSTGRTPPDLVNGASGPAWWQGRFHRRAHQAGAGRRRDRICSANRVLGLSCLADVLETGPLGRAGIGEPHVRVGLPVAGVVWLHVGLGVLPRLTRCPSGIAPSSIGAAEPTPYPPSRISSSDEVRRPPRVTVGSSSDWSTSF